MHKTRTVRYIICKELVQNAICQGVRNLWQIHRLVMHACFPCGYRTPEITHTISIPDERRLVFAYINILFELLNYQYFHVQSANKKYQTFRRQRLFRFEPLHHPVRPPQQRRPAQPLWGWPGPIHQGGWLLARVGAVTMAISDKSWNAMFDSLWITMSWCKPIHDMPCKWIT